MPLSDKLIDELYGTDISAIHMGIRNGSKEEHVTHFLGGSKIWLSRQEIIARMQNGKKFYARTGDWRGELELVIDEAGTIVCVRTVPDTAGVYSLLSLPRA